MITRKLSPKGRSTRVVFSLPGEAVQESAVVMGDFNDWSEEKHPMKYDKKKDVWSCGVSLKPGNSYRFRYLVDGEYRNEEDADDYEPSPYFSDNCVIAV